VVDMSDALADLNRRILAGAEFPDACVAVAFAFKVRPVLLRDAYDAQWADR